MDHTHFCNLEISSCTGEFLVGMAALKTNPTKYTQNTSDFLKIALAHLRQLSKHVPS